MVTRSFNGGVVLRTVPAAACLALWPSVALADAGPLLAVGILALIALQAMLGLALVVPKAIRECWRSAGLAYTIGLGVGWLFFLAVPVQDFRLLYVFAAAALAWFLAVRAYFHRFHFSS